MEVGLACVHFDAPAVLAAIAAGGPAAEAVGHGFFGRLAQADNVITQGGPGARPRGLSSLSFCTLLFFYLRSHVSAHASLNLVASLCR